MCLSNLHLKLISFLITITLQLNFSFRKCFTLFFSLPSIPRPRWHDREFWDDLQKSSLTESRCNCFRHWRHRWPHRFLLQQIRNRLHWQIPLQCQAPNNFGFNYQFLFKESRNKSITSKHKTLTSSIFCVFRSKQTHLRHQAFKQSFLNFWNVSSEYIEFTFYSSILYNVRGKWSWVWISWDQNS